jgi:cell division protein FtsQ
LRPLSAPPRGLPAAPAPKAAPKAPPLRYRLNRLWRRRAFRRAVTVQIPALAFAAVAAWAASNPVIHAEATRRWDDARAALTRLPDFAVRRIEVRGASPMVEAEIRAALIDVTGASSLDLDAAALRRRIESLGWVASARVSLEAPEALTVDVVERVARAVWRVDGEPALIDETGAVVTPAFRRSDHPDLPLVVGQGANLAVAEALAILDVAGELKPRIRGLIRVGERRWDVALDRDMVIRLPMGDPVAAMAEAAALERREGLFEKDILALDLRLPERPTIRLHPRAVETMSARRLALLGGKDA